MNKSVKSVIGVLTMSIAVMVSCKKNPGPGTASLLEGGAWTINKTYLDTNKNGVMDANEMFVDTSYAHEQFKFNADGTFVETYYGSPVKQATWALENNNTSLAFTDTGANGTTSHLQILTLTANSLELKSNASPNNTFTSWDYFGR